jgi:FdhD protein
MSDANEAVLRVEPLRISTAGGPAVRDCCDVVVEELLTVMVEGVGNFAVMCTPCDVEALAVGFVFSEGLIDSLDDVIALMHRPDQHVVAMRIEEPGRNVAERNLIVTSSCGLCGSRNIDRMLTGQVSSGDSLRIPASHLRSVADEMSRRQQLFTRTGGTHAAGIFSSAGELITFGEDLGRHNALDKAVGKCLMQRASPRGLAAFLSGRVSLELVAKAARAGIEIVAAVSAPSSLAIQAAEQCNITLCGFVRGERATVYSHPRRIVGVGDVA